MSHYRLYFLHAAHGHIEIARDIEASNDAEAIKAAQLLVTHRPIEIWSGTRKIGRCETPSGAWVERVRAKRAAKEFGERQRVELGKYGLAPADGQRFAERNGEHQIRL